MVATYVNSIHLDQFLRGYIIRRIGSFGKLGGVVEVVCCSRRRSLTRLRIAQIFGSFQLLGDISIHRL